MRHPNFRFNKEESEKDICVKCKKPTQYTKDTNIDFRKCYVEGAGQLCDECYDKIYETKPEKK